MIRTIGVDPTATNVVVVDEESIDNGVDDSKIDRVKAGAKVGKFKSKNQNNSKNLVNTLAQSSGVGFLLLEL